MDTFDPNLMELSLDELLRFDSLGCAEQITGESYTSSQKTVRLVMALKNDQEIILRRRLESDSDTFRNCEYGVYCEVLAVEGFSRVLQMPFRRRDQDELLEIWWNPEGVLLRFDTFLGGKVPTISSSNFYYNWQPKAELRADHSWFNMVSTGILCGPKDARVWSGSHDGREGLRHHLHDLRKNGVFLSPWKYDPMLWLLRDGDEVGEFEAINSERIALLPLEVQDAVTGHLLENG